MNFGGLAYLGLGFEAVPGCCEHFAVVVGEVGKGGHGVGWVVFGFGLS